jgi:hypothetical protein
LAGYGRLYHMQRGLAQSHHCVRKATREEEKHYYQRKFKVEFESRNVTHTHTQIKDEESRDMVDIKEKMSGTKKNNKRTKCRLLRWVGWFVQTMGRKREGERSEFDKMTFQRQRDLILHRNLQSKFATSCV